MVDIFQAQIRNNFSYLELLYSVLGVLQRFCLTYALFLYILVYTDIYRRIVMEKPIINCSDCKHWIWTNDNCDYPDNRKYDYKGELSYRLLPSHINLRHDCRWFEHKFKLTGFLANIYYSLK